LGEKGLRSGIDWKVNLGVLVLLLVLVISLVAVLVFLILPLALRKRGRVRQSIADRCFILLPWAWVTFSWRLPSSSASCFFWDIPPTPDGCNFSADAVERRGQPVFAAWLPHTELAGCRSCW
jgi:hypothetical protein